MNWHALGKIVLFSSLGYLVFVISIFLTEEKFLSRIIECEIKLESRSSGKPGLPSDNVYVLAATAQVIHSHDEKNTVSISQDVSRSTRCFNVNETVDIFISPLSPNTARNANSKYNWADRLAAPGLGLLLGWFLLISNKRQS